MKDFLDKAILINKGLVNWKLIDREVVFLHNKEKAFYELNRTATYVWLNANGKRSVSDIIKGLAKEFVITKDKAEKDVLDFITEAVKNKIFILSK